MAIKENPGDQKTRTSLLLVISSGLCLIFYVLGAWHRSGPGKGDSIAIAIAEKADCTTDLPDLNVEKHHDMSASIDESETRNFEPCADNFTDYTPCQDQRRAMTFPRGNMVYRERHCPPDEEKIYCLIPAPKGYVAPFQWPKSRDYAAYVNVPYKSLTVEKAIQNWVQFQGNVFRFPGGGTQFPKGADNYIDQLSSVVPISDGTVRTVLDTGCGVASLGAYLLGRNVLTMSFAPRDSHEAQVQFALERGVPAVIGVLGSIKLPYPSRAFDMAHCSRCLIPWGENGGMYLMEVDRVLRPGGYWVLSGPPINWRTNYEAWERTKEDLGEEQRKIEETAKLLCWEKVTEIAEIGIWRKRINADSCSLRKDQSRVSMCSSADSNDVWYKEMEPCITRYPEVNSLAEVAGGELLQFPKRLNSVPPRIASGSISGFTAESFQQYNKLWQKHVTEYKRVNKLLDSGRYRNIMDMNAGLGGFAAAIESPKLWVMNVVPTISDISTLGVIYERGLIGIYHDWCEAFSTYPRTYDLIHADGVFSLYQGNIEREIEVHFGTVPVLNLGSFPDLRFSDVNHFPNKHRCKMEDILLEMDRILRPEGAVIFRENFNILIKVNKMVNGMRWKTKMTDHEDGSHMSEKILYAVKQYWVGGSESA